jgi:hypothetical protein
MWTMEAAPEFSLTDDQIDYLAIILDHQTWPLVLDVAPRHDRAHLRDAAHATAHHELTRQGILCRDPFTRAGVTESLADSLAILTNPDTVLEVRRYDADGSSRWCVARSGTEHVLARRTPKGLTVRAITITDATELGVVVAGELGPGRAADVPSISAPAAEVRERLDASTTAADYADALYAIGACPAAASTYSAALESCTGHSEIVAIETGPGSRTRTAGAVAIYDTVRGRIVASPTTSPDGRVWTTLSTGTPHRIAQATALLMESLPTGRWMP